MLQSLTKQIGNRWNTSSKAKRRLCTQRKGRSLLELESLEERTLLSVVAPGVVVTGHSSIHPDGSPSSGPFTPAQIRHAYGFDRIAFNNDTIVGDGSGQMIAIVDAYDDPQLVSTGNARFNVSDLHLFDVKYGLPDPPNFTKVDQNGGTSYPATDPGNPDASPPTPPGGWEVEEALDVEWAHAMAPGANILLVETNDGYPENLYAGVVFAAQQPGVSVVSMSWGGSAIFDPALGDMGNSAANSLFTTPSGHSGVAFVAGSGDSGVIEYPSVAPTVLGVGGTTLLLDSANNTISSETAWSGSGGGFWGYLPFGFIPDPSTAAHPPVVLRHSPDVAYDADPSTGVWIYNSFLTGYAGPLTSIGGTSAGAPQWAALIAIADQGRALSGLGTLDSGGLLDLIGSHSPLLDSIYSLPASDFHDITSGSNALYSAGPGYDLVTGLGTPVANRIAAHLAGVPFNQVPVANDDSYAMFANETRFFSAADGLLANDTDAENDPLQALLVSLPSHGDIGFYKDGSFVYTPHTDFIGQDTFTYQTQDVDGVSNVATVTITVQPVILFVGGVLYINGDRQAHDLNNYITIDQTRQGGVLINFNGYVAEYAPGQVNGIVINGGGGNDTINIEKTSASTPVTVYLEDGNHVVNLSPTDQLLANIQGQVTVVGGTGFGTLNVDDQADPSFSPWTVEQSSLTHIIQSQTGEFSTTTVNFSNISDLTINGGSGGATVHVLSLPSNQSSLLLNGGAGNNTLQGPDAYSLWTISGPNHGTVGTFTLDGQTGGTFNSFTFQGFQSLQGGSGGDVFSFQNGGSLSGSLDGGGGVNMLDYSRYQGDALVDLVLHAASLVGQGVFNVQNVLGSQGNDILVGDANPNFLFGGRGRNLIIGGGGPDLILGGGGDNILIGGTTNYDRDVAALDAIMAEFTRTDESFNQRVSNIMNGRGLLKGTGVRLNRTTVHADDSPDQLWSGPGRNWFLVDSDDTMNGGTGPHRGDRVTRVP